MRSGEEGDLAVAEAHKMIHGFVNSGGVVEQNGAGLGVVEFEFGKNDGHVAMDELIEHRFLFAERHDGDAFNFALEHAAHALGEHNRIAV